MVALTRGSLMLNETNGAFLAELAEITKTHTAEPRYLEEPRGRFHGQLGALVKPQNVTEVAAIVRLCNARKVGVVPYGGGTGLVCGQLSPEGPAPVVLSLERMNAIREADPVDNIMTVEAGVILSDIHRAADEVSRLFPLSLASEGSCQIGGNLATNAGGVNVLRYGNARDLCLGVEAVLPDGTVFNGLRRLRKDNSGYDLRNLLIGAEGTLGVITAASLKLFPKPVEVAAAFIAVPSPDAALALLGALSARLGNVISAFELIHRAGLEFLAETGLGIIAPLAGDPEWMVLVECGGVSGTQTGLEEALADSFDMGYLSDAVIAQNEAQRMAFWHIRETIPEANKRIGSVSSHDISVPVKHVPAFIAEAAGIVRDVNPAFRVNCFGHLGDGNLHYNVFPPKGVARTAFDDVRHEVQNGIYELVARFDGSFSAEHGIGRMKKADLNRYGDAGMISAMRSIKAALDPNGIMNPGAVL